jgi:hypothetical protein
MDAVVHDDEKDPRRRCCYVRMPTVEKYGDVVIPVQEDKWLLVDDDKECVNQLASGYRSKCNSVRLISNRRRRGGTETGQAASTYGNLLRMKSCTHNPEDPDPYVARGSKHRLSLMLM